MKQTKAKHKHKTQDAQCVRILCIADEIDPLVYSKNMKERFSSADLVLGAGDLPMKYYSFIVSMINKPLYFVFGNHDLKYFRRFKGPSCACSITPQQADVSYLSTDYFGSVYIGDRVFYDRKHKLIIVGMGGSLRYNKGENQYTQRQMYWKIFRLFPKLLWNRVFRGRWCDIMLTHAPPFGIHDKSDICHTGFKAFLMFMHVFKPKYLLHGHVHLTDLNEEREDQFENTRIINVYGRYILEVKR